MLLFNAFSVTPFSVLTLLAGLLGVYSFRPFGRLVSANVFSVPTLSAVPFSAFILTFMFLTALISAVYIFSRPVFSPRHALRRRLSNF